MIGSNVTLTLYEGDPVSGEVSAWTPAGITFVGLGFFSWVVISSWEEQ